MSGSLIIGDAGEEPLFLNLDRLIAAAPDLLAALEHILTGALSLPRFAEDEARAAIAKARGAGHDS